MDEDYAGERKLARVSSTLGILSITVLIFIYYRGIVRCLCTINSRNPVSPTISTPRCGDQKMQSPELRLCTRRQEAFILFSFFFERTSSLSADHSTALVTTLTGSSWARNWGGESSLYLALALTTSNSSESDSWIAWTSIGAEETAARASQPWDEALNLSSEGRDKAVPVSNSADRSICEPQDCSLRCASAAVRPEPWGTQTWAPSLWKNARWDRSFCKGSTLQCSQPVLSSAERACSSPKQATQRTCVSPPIK